MHQREDGGVHANADGKRKNGQRGKGRRLEPLTDRETEIVHMIAYISLDNPTITQLHDPFTVRGVFLGVRHLHDGHSFFI